MVPRLNATYRIADHALTYATFSEGFRSGGTNALRSRSILPRDYDSDKLKNYEIGLKSEWLDNTLRFNTVAYYMQWDDMQIQVNDPTVFSLGIVNFSEAGIRGFEAELSWLPAAGWKIDVNLALIDAQIAEDNIILSDSGEVIANVEKGTQLPSRPEEKASVAVQYTFQKSWLGAEPYARLDWSYVGESVNSLAGTESIVFTRGPTTQPDYGIGDLRLGLDASQWSATLYVENITDETAEQFYNNRWGLRQRVSINRPRTAGIRLRWRF
ncbi:MAG: TonB-dependent receptor [Halioglobus sp.]|nr:TonB-dependent receptor [Halioglobus sp.]